MSQYALILGKGFIGQHVHSHLSGQSNDRYIDCVRQKDIDYTNIDKLRAFIRTVKPKTIITCFGFTGRPNIDEAEKRKQECWNLNCVIPVNINRLCREENIGHIHISSGCIYQGSKDHPYKEEDVPNFGLFNDESSFYSKSKHAYELQASDYGTTIRIRMPISPDLNPRNYLAKLISYNELINYFNSKTYIPDLCKFINMLISMNPDELTNIGIINFAHSNPLNTYSVCEIMAQYLLRNPLWRFVEIEDLNIVAGRSNCVLSLDKMDKLFPDFELREELAIIHEACYLIKNK